MVEDGAIQLRRHANAMPDTVALIAPSLIASMTVLATALATQQVRVFATLAGLVRIALSQFVVDALIMVHVPWTGVADANSHGQVSIVLFACVSETAVATELA